MISVKLSEWDESHPAENRELRDFRLTTTKARRIAEILTKQRALEFSAREDGLALRSFSHVGRIELEELTVTVRPKLASDALLELLRYAYSLRDLRLLDDSSFE